MMAAINCVLMRDSLTAAAAGIAMAYALQITSQLNLMVSDYIIAIVVAV